ncbi:MAG: L-lactate dehydrogenase [Oscillospiraceae bacterium]|jgi:L-lactate dehydrogenase|nr:L-lactate dehydrogenase [Oscillospiraceae bacterium]
MPKKKIAVVGAGFVGSTAAYTMMMNNTADEIVLIDINRDKAEGDALDMNHGMSFLPPVRFYSGWYGDCADAALVVLTAGAAQKPGERRMELLGRNLRVFDDILSQLLPNLAPNALLLTVTNPVDVLTQYVLERSGLPPSRVMGSGTVLDTSRLKWAIAEQVGVDPRNVHTFVVGEHGDTEVAAFSATTVSGMRLDQYCGGAPLGMSGTGAGYRQSLLSCEAFFHSLHDGVRRAAYGIIEKKGATYYAVALAVNRIAEAALNDQKAVLTVSGLVDGAYGIGGVCLSLPRVVGAGGIERLLEVPYDGGEIRALRHSAETIRKAYAAACVPVRA